VEEVQVRARVGGFVTNVEFATAPSSIPAICFT
jgi:hypothetical protein